MKKLFIIFAIVCLASPVMAADWNFYGSARMATFSVNRDTDTNAHLSSQTNTEWDQQGNSRIGATVKFNDQIGGGFEMSDSFGKRKLYGTYMFGNGAELLLGQTYTPSAWFLSNSVYDGDGDLLGRGEFYEGRLPMVRLKMGGFQVALIKPALVNPDDTLYVTKNTIPKIEASYNFKTDMFFANAFGGYHTYDLDGITTATKDLTVNSYVFGVGGGMNFGALYVNLGGHIGQNMGNYGAYNPSAIDMDMIISTDQKEKDTTGWGAEGVVGFNASEMLTIEAGYGYEYGEKDVSHADGSSVYQMYLNATINIAPGFFIVPEVGYIEADYDTQGTQPDPNPSITYFGAKWQINF
jgi:hypothetical protein